MKTLKEYSNQEIDKVWDFVDNMKDWNKISMSGLYKKSERNNRMVDRIYFSLDINKTDKNTILNKLNSGENPEFISRNGCHESYFWWKMDGFEFGTNMSLID